MKVPSENTIHLLGIGGYRRLMFAATVAKEMPWIFDALNAISKDVLNSDSEFQIDMFLRVAKQASLDCERIVQRIVDDIGYDVMEYDVTVKEFEPISLDRAFDLGMWAAEFKQELFERSQK